MKKLLIIFLSVLFVCCSLAFAGCNAGGNGGDNGNDNHEHFACEACGKGIDPECYESGNGCICPPPHWHDSCSKCGKCKKTNCPDGDICVGHSDVTQDEWRIELEHLRTIPSNISYVRKEIDAQSEEVLSVYTIDVRGSDMKISDGKVTTYYLFSLSSLDGERYGERYVETSSSVQKVETSYISTSVVIRDLRDFDFIKYLEGRYEHFTLSADTGEYAYETDRGYLFYDTNFMNGIYYDNIKFAVKFFNENFVSLVFSGYNPEGNLEEITITDTPENFTLPTNATTHNHVVCATCGKCKDMLCIGDDSAKCIGESVEASAWNTQITNVINKDNYVIEKVESVVISGETISTEEIFKVNGNTAFSDCPNDAGYTFYYAFGLEGTSWTYFEDGDVFNRVEVNENTTNTYTTLEKLNKNILGWLYAVKDDFASATYNQETGAYRLTISNRDISDLANEFNIESQTLSNVKLDLYFIGGDLGKVEFTYTYNILGYERTHTGVVTFGVCDEIVLPEYSVSHTHTPCAICGKCTNTDECIGVTASLDKCKGHDGE